ncbi:MAG TPA: EVE domain-containing protein [Rhizobiales bacterium]|nr:EVE domain-containing protein [Hyphomicrobiales bacterium]
MAYWLFKSEPNTWGWDQQLAKGEEGEQWDGVRNYQARNNMQKMKLGDKGFFYHSINEKSIVGVVEVCAEAHPDTTDDTGKWHCVDIKAIKSVVNPVTLDDCKAHPDLANMILVNNSRLSVQPVSEEEWAIVCQMAGIEA